MSTTSFARWVRRWGFPLGSGALLMICALITIVLARYGESSRWTLHTHEVLTRIATLETALARGGEAELLEQVDELGRAVDDNPAQIARVDRLRNQIARPDPPAAVELLRDMRGEEQHLLRRRTEAAAAFARLATDLMVIGALFAITLVTLAYAFMRRALRANAAQANLLRSIFDSIGDGLIVTNTNGVFTHFNRPAGRVLGLNLESVRTITDLHHILGTKIGESPTRRALDGESVENYEVELRRGPRPRFISVDSRPVLGSDGRRQGALALLRDVTERRGLEDEWRRARESALEASRLKSDFLVTMSHEIRTPMNGVIGMSTLLLDTRLDAEQLSLVKTIKTSADALMALINQVLDHARIESGKLELEDVDFDLIDLMDEALDLFRYLARAKAVELKLDIAKDVPRALRGDAARLRQVVINLVGNALKFTDEGFVEVSARLISAAEGDGRHQIKFTVRDTGHGISPAAQARLFQKFSQVHTSGDRGGSGLGLMISRELVRAMGGEIGVDSAENVGSRFVFTVQMAPAASCPLRPRVAEPATTPLRGRVLVAEDQPVNQLVIRKYLERLGIAHDVVADGAAALDASIRTHYDLILMDCQMRPMDGYEATRRIREREAARAAARRIPIVALTAEGMSGDRRRCFEVGMDAFLPKPIALEQLHTMMKTYLPEDDAARAASYDEDSLRKLDGFESGGRPLVTVLIDDFSLNARAEVERLGSAAGRAAWADVRHLAHALKSAGRTLGLVAFGDVCERLEHEADGRDVAELIAAVERSFTAGLQWLNERKGE